MNLCMQMWERDGRPVDTHTHRYFLKMPFLILTFCMHVNWGLVHWKWSFEKTSSRVKIFRTSVFSIHVLTGRNQLFGNQNDLSVFVESLANVNSEYALWYQSICVSTLTEWMSCCSADEITSSRTILWRADMFKVFMQLSNQQLAALVTMSRVTNVQKCFPICEISRSTWASYEKLWWKLYFLLKPLLGCQIQVLTPPCGWQEQTSAGVDGWSVGLPGWKCRYSRATCRRGCQLLAESGRPKCWTPSRKILTFWGVCFITELS